MTTQHFTIGYFATQTGLSIRALRLYDEIGVLKPAIVNHKNKYRYYQPEQILIGKQIKTYRENDLPLEEIKQILEQPQNLAQTLQAHLERLRQRLIEDQNMIGQLEQMLLETR